MVWKSTSKRLRPHARISSHSSMIGVERSRIVSCWRSIGWALVLVGLGGIGDARLTAIDPARVSQQQHDLATSIVYAAAIAVLLWALLRLPVTGRRGTGTRFLLDALTISVTVGVFAWYFTVRALNAGDGQRTTVPMLMLAVLGLIVALAMVKVAMSGTAGLEHGTLRWFATAAGVGTVGVAMVVMVLIRIRRICRSGSPRQCRSPSWWSCP